MTKFGDTARDVAFLEYVELFYCDASEEVVFRSPSSVCQAAAFSLPLFISGGRSNK